MPATKIVVALAASMALSASAVPAASAAPSAKSSLSTTDPSSAFGKGAMGEALRALR